MSTARIPCINPSCRRTAAAEKFPDSDEIICGKCFRLLPLSLRRRHKTFWRRNARLLRLLKRRDMLARQEQIARLGDINDRLGWRVWRAIRAFFDPVERPAGLDAFLEEVGL